MADAHTTQPRQKGRRNRYRVAGIRIDMTPMVDLAFLLLTFFILATTLSMTRTVEIAYPKKGPVTKISDKTATTFIIGDKEEEIYYYPGEFVPGKTKLQTMSLRGDELAKLVKEKNASILSRLLALKEQYRRQLISAAVYKETKSEIRKDDNAPFFMIKSGEKAKYKTIIRILDDLNENACAKYAVVDISDPEKAALLEMRTTKL
jgi:biopolymer transport protein ExbD